MKKANTFKRFTGLTAAALMAACMVAPMATSAATLLGGKSITITNSDNANHTYAAYQIFAGSFNGGVLTNIEWGDAVDGDSIITALKNDTTFGAEEANLFYGCTTAKDVADVLATFDSDNATGTDADPTKIKAFANIIGANINTSKTSGSFNSETNVISNLPDGYYLVEDSAAPTVSDPDNGTGAKTRYIVHVTDSDNVSINAKHSIPSVVKKVKENSSNNVADNGTITNGWIENNDKFNDVADYSTSETIPFKLIGTLPETFADYEHYYYEFTDTLSKGFIKPEVDDFTVAISGVNSLPDNAYVITISQADDNTENPIIISIKFTDIAAIEGVGANSVITVDYTAKLDSDAVIGLDGNPNDVKLTYSNNPNATGDGTTKPTDTGETPKDKVVVFTYELDVTKYLGSTNTTANATEGTKAGFILKNSDGNYAKITDGVITSWETDISKATEVTTGADGTFKFVGLDEGAYTLIEKTVPTGYNKMEDLALTITAETNNVQNWAGDANDALTALKLYHGATEVDNAGNLDSGSVSDSIINKKGSELPSTGGIGTTIFYVGGGAMVAVAGIFLITKKRMNKKED